MTLGDRKPSKLLHEMSYSYLLDAYHMSDSQSQAVSRKLFLDKLPVQVGSILAGLFDSNVNSVTLRADEIMAAFRYSNDNNSSQHLINEIID